MNTDKAKNIIIILLAALNVALFGLLFMEFGRFRLSGTHEAAVRDLFLQNNIEITASIPRNFRPQRGLYVRPFAHDIDTHAANFFPEGAVITQEAWDSVTFASGYETLEISGLHYGNFVLEYQNQAGFTTAEFAQNRLSDIEAVRALAHEFVRRVTPPELDFVYTYSNIFYEDEIAAVWFRGYYRGYILRDNLLHISISNHGIFWAELNFTCVPHGFSRQRREIISADEALFNALQYLVPHYPGSDVSVYDISVAFLLPNLVDSLADEELITTAPGYRIVVQIDGTKKTIWVNAVTNERFVV